MVGATVDCAKVPSLVAPTIGGPLISDVEREAGKQDEAPDAGAIAAKLADVADSTFVGYDHLETKARLTRVIDGRFAAPPSRSSWS